MTRTRLYWICQLAGWSLALGAFVGLAFLTGGFYGPSESWRVIVFATVLFYAMCIGGTHAVHVVAVRREWPKLPLHALVPRLILAVVVAAALVPIPAHVLSAIAEPFVNPRAQAPLPTPSVSDSVGGTLMLAALFSIWAIVYALVVSGFRLRDAERDRLRLRAALAEARMATLESQLNPHFLFNALNTVRALVTEDPAEARRAVTLLSALLRQTLATARSATQPLAAELDVVRAYLALEALRFGDRLRVCVEADPDALDVPVPALLVQTLAENAVKHGVARRRDGGEVSVTASLAGDRLTVRVTNPAPAAASGPSEGTGTGLANARERLALLFGDRARLSLDVDAEQAVALADIPLAPASHA